MAFESNGTGLSAADVAAVTGGNGGMFGGGNDGGAWWLMVLFLFAFMNGGRWGGNGGSDSITQSELQAGLNQQTLQNGQFNIMEQLSDNRSELQSQMSTLAMAQQQCCCDSREAIANLRYDIATQAAADRAEIASQVREVLTQSAQQNQRILDQLCQDKIDAKNEEIANLRTQLNMAALNASQNAQTAAILADNARQTTAIEQYLNPAPIPAYVVQNPNCCTQNFGCGCAVA